MTKKVLLVSSDPNYFEDPGHAFQMRGCDVFTAMSGEEAVDFLNRYGADLTIFNGVPENVQPEAVEAIAQGVIIVLAEGSDGGWTAVESAHVLKAPYEGKKLLKLSSKLLGAVDRKYISILVQVRVTQPKATTIFGKSRDLSDTGILVETNQTLLMHDHVVVSFLIPGADRMIQTEALVMREVVRTGGARRYGLKFMSLPEEDQVIVTDFLGGKLAQ